MAIYTIADLHLSLGTDKPMDIFPGWENHAMRIKNNWEKTVKENDTVVIPGDISWAMKIENCLQDFLFIEKLPGKKIILKGNHDYWWTTMRKMDTFLENNNIKSISFLLNNSYIVENVAICGTRSWLFDVGEAHDLKVMNRELMRLRASLNAAGDSEKIVFLHYPPIYYNAKSEEVIEILKEYNIKQCFYGHLHAASINYAIQGNVDGIKYKLISADALRFMPFKII
ncbi:MAG: metallophosphoesterase [Oscillospiraceae bacterium]